MNTRSLGIALVFVAGCAVGGASSRFVVPPASAQQAATLTKWDYTCFAQDTAYSPSAMATDVTSKSKQAGAQGWEMGAVFNGVWCFKRPM